MSGQQGLAFAILALTLVMFLWGRWRYDVVAVFAMLAVAVTGLVPPAEVFAGFSHPAVITVGAVLIISRGLQNAGLVDAVVKAISPLRSHPDLQLAAQCVVIAILSSFMNNVGALALMLPVALRNAYHGGHPPAKSLMPLAFASLLGGLTTLIGTPPNIIVASYRAEQAGAPFGMFAFTPVGTAVAVAGLAFMLVFGWRLLPSSNGRSERAEFTVEGYVTEAEVPEGSKAIGMTIRELEELADEDLVIAGFVREKKRSLVPPGSRRLQEGDVLILEGDTDTLATFLNDAGLKLSGNEELGSAALKSDDIDVVEAVVSPGSPVIGRSPASLRLRTVYEVNLLAIARLGRRVSSRLQETKFRAGDVVLLQGRRDGMADVLSRLGCLPLAERSLTIGRQQRLILAGGAFASAIALVVAGLSPVHVAFTAVAALLVATGIVRPTEVYSSIDGPVLVLLAAMFPVSAALESTGGAALIADGIVRLTDGLAVAWVILILLVGTMFVSDIINNNATALLMAPVAVTIAERVGANADPFLIAVALGASCAFLTPIGHQSNTLVMEPGGYRFGDYWRLGLPLEAVIVAVGLPMILWCWPP